MKRKGALVSFLAILIILVFTNFSTVPALANVNSAGCERKEISRGPSTQKWIVVTQQQVCSDGWFITTSALVIQIIEKEQKNAKDIDIIIVDDYGNPRPSVKWTSDYHLQIVVPARIHFSVKTKKIEDVTITVIPPQSPK